MSKYPRVLFLFSLSVLVLVLSYSCSAEAPLPKPRMYPKIEYPAAAEWTQFDAPYCDFSFPLPQYVAVEQDSLFFDEKPAHPCWFDLVYPTLNGRVHFSYYPIESRADFEKLRDDAFRMADYHNKRANYIDEILLSPTPGTGGLAFDIGGPAASPYQFFLTDSTQHFVRAALYFNAQARPDSLAPVTAFVKDDIRRMIAGFAWE